MRLLAPLVALTVIASSGPSLGQDDTNSANWVMPGCLSSSTSFRQGVCSGTVNAIVLVGPLLPSELRICAPATATNTQAVKVVVAYFQRIPARMHEPFAGLTIEALRRAWPC